VADWNGDSNDKNAGQDIGMISFRNGAQNYIFAQYEDENMQGYAGTDRIHVVEVLTYPFDSTDVYTSISILPGQNLDMPGNGHYMNMEVLQSGEILGFSMDANVTGKEEFDKLESKALFFNKFCSYKEFKSKESGECLPCKPNSFSISGPYSEVCYKCSDVNRLPY
jgi:hypothetical protein